MSVAATHTVRPGQDGQVIHTVTWALTAATQGSWVEFPQGLNRSVHVFGTWSAGSPEVHIEGSNESVPANPAALNDPQGNSLVISTQTDPVMKQILEAPLHVRATMEGGDSSTAITVIMTCIAPR